MKKQSIRMLLASALFLRLAYLFMSGNLPFLNECRIDRVGQEFLVDPTCLLQGKLPKLWLQESVDAMWDNIKGFQTMYVSQTSGFLYAGTHPVFRKSYPSLLPVTEKEIDAMNQVAKQGKKVKISLQQLAYQYVSGFAFYVADKDISLLKPCTKTNYTLALTSIDKILLKPGETFNYNNHLKNLYGYCDGIDNDIRLFYGGVCGVSSQIFRASLIQPDISILQRHSHNERFTVYYGEKAEGDDAAVVEMRKQFEIKNSGTEPLYFRTKTQGTRTYVVIIAAQWPDKKVQISKNYISDLEVELTRQIFQTDWTPDVYGMPDGQLGGDVSRKILKEETYSSKYLNKNNESR